VEPKECEVEFEEGWTPVPEGITDPRTPYVDRELLKSGMANITTKTEVVPPNKGVLGAIRRPTTFRVLASGDRRLNSCRHASAFPIDS